ncbi:hypothetical protein MF271_19270 (plasmid) [Deinococcus sp. KNUC1210]|uniref:hypothetical protein n=1 Tax=Deinococcus sp. KNUC1210 TaxID=2917691 RepID=UPI001EEF826F|nr:hypothetical protein [Deinococcus sp. KNUC1210]ULH17332.1 hypothetical protein MF271_19270 [Deinococcus sp. KNUC1210]
MEQQHSIFQGLDLSVILYAAGMAALISVLTTWRSRNAQRARGLPLSPWLTVIPDMLIGTITGVIFALVGPVLYKPLHSLAGITTLAGAGGVLGPKIWDLISARGLDLGLTWLASAVAGPLAALATRAAAKDGDSNGTKPTPPPPTPPGDPHGP